MGDSYHVGIKNMLDYDTHALCLVVVTTTMQRLWIPYCFEIRLRYNYSGILLNRNGMAKLAGIMNHSCKDLNWNVTSIRMRVVTSPIRM